VSRENRLRQDNKTGPNDNGFRIPCVKHALIEIDLRPLRHFESDVIPTFQFSGAFKDFGIVLASINRPNPQAFVEIVFLFAANGRSVFSAASLALALARSQDPN
jgi:hypothetical protein